MCWIFKVKALTSVRCCGLTQAVLFFRYRGQIGASLILGGVDCTGSHLYTVGPYGSVDKKPYLAMGMSSDTVVLAPPTVCVVNCTHLPHRLVFIQNPSAVCFWNCTFLFRNRFNRFFTIKPFTVLYFNLAVLQGLVIWLRWGSWRTASDLTWR